MENTNRMIFKDDENADVPFDYHILGLSDKFFIQYYCEHSILGLGRYESFLISSSQYITPGSPLFKDFYDNVLKEIKKVFEKTDQGAFRRFYTGFNNYF